uniref:PAP-associated domain-containing protein n=1 Tax=Panagrellus redivivus TaxID=6233 RepID=A0A7E4UMY3_PANRE
MESSSVEPTKGSARHTLSVWATWTKAVIETNSIANDDQPQSAFKVTYHINGVPRELLFGQGSNADENLAKDQAAQQMAGIMFRQNIIPQELGILIVKKGIDKADALLISDCQARWTQFLEVIASDHTLDEYAWDDAAPPADVINAIWEKYNHALTNPRKRKHSNEIEHGSPKKSTTAEREDKSPSPEEGEITSTSPPTEAVNREDSTEFHPETFALLQAEVHDDRESSPLIDMNAVSNDVDINGVYQSAGAEPGDITIDEEEEANLDDDGSLTIAAIEDAPIDLQHPPVYGFGPRPDYNYGAWQKTAASFRKAHPQVHDVINESIMKHYAVNIQNADTLAWKDIARRSIETVIRTLFSSARVYAVGSTMNGCGAYNSDMDVCVVIDENQLNDGSGARVFNNKKRIVNALYFIRRAMKNELIIARKMIVINAVVPILQVSFSGCFAGLEVDVNINNIAGIYNTHLIHHYARLDERFPALCLLVKHWALVEGINSAQDGTFNSYSLILLVLHYMQCVVQPAILPNLQELYPETFNGTTPVEQLVFNENVCTFESQNRDDHATLLLGFFHYYHDFDFTNYAISIRKACVYPKASLGEEAMNQYAIFIEEPYDCNNTARCARNNGYEAIKAAFKRAYKQLWNSKKPGLARIGIDVKL